MLLHMHFIDSFFGFSIFFCTLTAKNNVTFSRCHAYIVSPFTDILKFFLYRTFERIEWTYNKTAGHHRHIFCPLILLKISFRKMKAVFQIKNSSDFCKKPWIQVEKRHIYEIISFDTHSTANLPHFLKSSKFKFFFRKNLFIFKKRNSVRFVKYYYFCRLLRQIWFTLDIINWQKCKNVWFQRFQSIIFLPYYKNGRKVIKKRYTTCWKLRFKSWEKPRKLSLAVKIRSWSIDKTRVWTCKSKSGKPKKIQ